VSPKEKRSKGRGGAFGLNRKERGGEKESSPTCLRKEHSFLGLQYGRLGPFASFSRGEVEVVGGAFTFTGKEGGGLPVHLVN